MKQTFKQKVNISAPNLINICVDQANDGEIQGRLYHCYDYDPIHFDSVVELVRYAEKLYDRLTYPQASTRLRSFVELDMMPTAKRPDKCMHQENLFQYKGELATFITFVKFRQNSTWQGEIFLVEDERKMNFSSVLEFIKIIDQRIVKGSCCFKHT